MICNLNSPLIFVEKHPACFLTARFPGAGPVSRRLQVASCWTGLLIGKETGLWR